MLKVAWLVNCGAEIEPRFVFDSKVVALELL